MTGPHWREIIHLMKAELFAESLFHSSAVFTKPTSLSYTFKCWFLCHAETYSVCSNCRIYVPDLYSIRMVCSSHVSSWKPVENSPLRRNGTSLCSRRYVWLALVLCLDCMEYILNYLNYIFLDISEYSKVCSLVGVSVYVCGCPGFKSHQGQFFFFLFWPHFLPSGSPPGHARGGDCPVHRCSQL